MRTYTIAPLPSVTLTRLGSVYVASFGVIWLFIEPLGAFGLLPSLGAFSGVTTYALLLIAPTLPMFGFLRWYRWHKIHNLRFIRLSIRSAADGATYLVRVAENMQVGEFVRQYVEILRNGPAKEQIETTLRRYYPVLQVQRNGVLHDIDSNLPIHAAGLHEGDECQVRAQEYEHLNKILFSRKVIHEGDDDA